MTWLTVSHMWNYIAKSGCDLSIQARLYRAPINHFIAWGLPLRRAWSQWEKASRSGGPCSPDKGDAKWLMWVKDLTIEGMDIWSGHLLGLIVIKKKKNKTKQQQILQTLSVTWYQPGWGTGLSTRFLTWFHWHSPSRGNLTLNKNYD